MTEQPSPGRRPRRAARRRRAIVDATLLVAALCLVASIVQSGVAASLQRAERRELGRQALELYRALDLYQDRHGAFPGESGPPLELATLEPLRRRGYLRAAIVARLDQRRLDGYHATTGDDGPEFWLEMTFAADPAVRFVVARSDDAPLSGGRWLDGAYVYHDGELSPL